MPKNQISNRPYILTRPYLNPSAKLLARELGLVKSYEPRNYPPVLRWGNSDIDSRHLTDSNVNNPNLIAVCANKLKFSVAMTHLEIPHVEILSGIPNKFPVVVRHNLSASRGIGIELVQGFGDFQRGWQNRAEVWNGVYWSQWRKFSFELGVHFFNGEILKVFKKIHRDEDAPVEDFPIKNASKGWGFSLVKSENYPKLQPIVQDFCTRFGIMFGRMDIGWNSERKAYEIIEVNTAPSLADNENTLTLYVEKLREILR